MATTLPIAETRSGDLAQDRLGTLFDAHHERLYRLARRMSASPDDARDLVQETFLRAAGHAHRIPEGPSREEAWLVRVLVNVCRDLRRRARVRERERSRLAPAETHARSHEEAALAKQAVQAALATLPERRRAIIVMLELEGRSVEQVATTLGLARVTVRWNRSRGRRELAACLSGGGRKAAIEETR